MIDPAAQARPPRVAGPARDACAVLDADGVVVAWSGAAERTLGWSPAEVVGRSCRGLLARSEDEADRALDRLKRERGTRTGRVGLRHRDGQIITVTGLLCPLQSATGPAGWLVLREDAPGAPAAPGSGSPVWEEFLASAPVGMAVLDAGLRYLWVNDALARGGGVPAAEMLGQQWGRLQPGLDTEAARRRLRQVLDGGDPVIDYPYHGRIQSDPGRERVFSMSAFRLEGSPETGRQVAFLVMDTTDRWQARERLTVLSDAGARIGSTLDVLRTAQELADVAVPRLADFVAVDLLDSVLRGDEPTAGSGVLIRSGQRSIRAESPESVAAVGEPAGYVPGSPVSGCVADGQAVLIPVFDADARGWMAADPVRAERIRAFGLRSAMVVPLLARGKSLGAATFLRWQSEVPFDEDDLVLAQEFVARAAVCVDNARCYTHEHASALALQESLQPYRLPHESTVEVAARYLPADAQHGVGGDWVDVIPLSGARTALVAGDVTGHGLNAAATMGRLRTAVHTLAALDLPPDELLAHLDDLVTRLAEEAPPGSDGPGATCLYLVYDPVAGTCTMARAGHPPPALVSPDGTVVLAELPAAPPLGLGGLPFESATVELSDQSVVALYTDGLIEACDRDIDLGLARLSTALAKTGRSVERLCDEVTGALLTGPQRDDVALLVARVHHLPHNRIATWEVPSDPTFVAQARRWANERLREWGLQDLEPTTSLVVSELVTNAIRYGSDPIRLRLIHHSSLICEVSDGSSTAPHLRHARATDEGGRGLFLIAQLASRWGTRHHPTGKTIWAEQEVSEPATSSAR